MRDDYYVVIPNCAHTRVGGRDAWNARLGVALTGRVDKMAHPKRYYPWESLAYWACGTGPNRIRDIILGKACIMGPFTGAQVI